MGDQEKLCFEIIKMEKPSGGSKKINSREKFFLYLIAFSLTINRYLCSDFENLSIKSTFSFTLQLINFT